MKYPKIQTLWKRHEDTGLILPGEFSKCEFDNVQYYHVTEKIHGTNIRVMMEAEGNFIKVSHAGRTDKATIPAHLEKFLLQRFREDNLHEHFPESHKVILFGEGYGNKIQDVGRTYLGDDVGFILFDVWIDGWWLEYDSVAEIAEKFHIPVVPSLGIMTKDEIIEFVKSEPKSKCSLQPLTMEGVVCTSAPMMLFRDGKPIKFKLKVNDYKKLEAKK